MYNAWYKLNGEWATFDRLFERTEAQATLWLAKSSSNCLVLRVTAIGVEVKTLGVGTIEPLGVGACLDGTIHT